MKTKEEILRYFPNNIRRKIENIIFLESKENGENKENKEKEKNIINEIEEIRIRVSKPLILRTRDEDIVIEHIITKEEIMYIVERICNNSIYAYKNQICEGFITCFGGHRVGIVGSMVVENNRIINIKYISCLNFRIAREVKNCSEKIIDEILDIVNNSIFNTIIVAPPGKGKTTILRDLIRKISNGIEEKNFTGLTCGIVDERGEIAAMYQGIPQNDIGIRTDVIENVSKEKGIEILIRSMAPQVIACDEIGTKEDVDAIERAMVSGVKGIFTMHGRTMEDVKSNEKIKNMIENKKIENVIFL